jgi:DNA-binding transcriptional LysR family regulator
MRDSLDGVAVFVEAVEAGGFARAAERLALTRSAVGKTVARMEARLGVRLFHRTTRSQSLTEDGQNYYERCLRALEELRAGEALLESGRREVSGKLKVSMPVLFGRYCVGPVLLELAQEHAKLELDLRFSDAVVDLIAEGFDLAIRNGAPGEGNGLRARKIASQRKLVCAAPSYLAAHGTPMDIAALASHDALVYWRHDQPFPWTLRGRDGKLIEAQLKWRLQFDSQEAIVDAAVSGMGIACVPSWLVGRQIAAGHLVSLLEQSPSASLDTYAVWPAAQHMPMRLRVTIDTLAARLQGVADL